MLAKMTGIFPVTVYPSYNNVTNYSGVNSAIRSAGVVQNAEQSQEITALERDGRLNLSQYGLVKLPREVLQLQDERGAKVKSTVQGDQVQKSNKTDHDTDRSLAKAQDATDQAVNALQGKSQNDASTGDKNSSKDGTTSTLNSVDAADSANKKINAKDNTATTQSNQDNQTSGQTDGATNDTTSSFTTAAPLTSVTGSPNTVYQTIQAGASSSDFRGQTLSVAA